MSSINLILSKIYRIISSNLYIYLLLIFNTNFCNAFKSTGEHLDIITTPYYSPFFSSVNGLITFNTTDYIIKLCDKNSTMYSQIDCQKVSSDEQRLFRQLMKNYERLVRPVFNASKPVVIKMGLTLAQIFDMEEKTQILVTNVWLDIEWVDEFLKWNPEDFNGLKVFRVSTKKIWLPDLVLYNNAADFTDFLMNTNAMVHYDGKVFWPVPTKLQSTCKVDVTFFPFDVQTCRLKFGSWTYDGFQVDITNRTSDIDLVNYVPNGEWDLVATSVIRNVVYYPCCPEPFPDVTFMIKIRRRIIYYLYNVIFPCVMLSALTLLAFIIPPDSGEKVALGITVLLAFSVFMLAVAENLPETSEYVPLLSIYLTVVMALTSVSVMCTVFVLNLYHRGPKRIRVPLWLRKLIVERVMKENEKNLSNIIADSQAENELPKDKGSPNQPLNFPLDFATKAQVRKTSDHYDNLDEVAANLILSPLSKENSLPNGQFVQIDIPKSNQPSEAATKLGKSSSKTNHNKLNNEKVYTNNIMRNLDDMDIDDDNDYCNTNCFHNKNRKRNNNNRNSSEINTKHSTGKNINNNLSSQENDSNHCYLTCSANDVLLTTSNSENFIQGNKHKSRKTARTRDEDYVFEFLLETMNDLNQRQKLEDIEKQIIKEWRIVAAFVDRVLFWIFLIMTLALTLTCLVFVPLSNK